MIAKMVLPLLGGTPAVWNTCMVFFQAALLAGYAYAHAISNWLGVRWQLVVHSIILLVPLAVLPIGIGGSLPDAESNPIPWLLAVLSISVGLPFLVLSTSAPLLQKWFAYTGHPSGKDPYFLYAASNLGSMLALLSYPTLVEPFLTLKAYAQHSGDVRTSVWMSQSWLWAAGYVLFILLMMACARAVWKSQSASATAEIDSEALPTKDEPAAKPAILTRLRWVALAFVPSSLMLGVTTHITLDIAAIPLLWVMPLALYLLSFILVFAKWPSVLHRTMILVMPLLVLLIAFLMESGLRIFISGLISLHLAMLFVVALACHGELARNRPPVRYLTQFYLLMSLGGVLGGLFNALVAPLAFNGIYEYPIAIACACLLLPPMSPSKSVWISRLFPQRFAGLIGVGIDIGLAMLLGLGTFGLFVFMGMTANEMQTAGEKLGGAYLWLANTFAPMHDGMWNGVQRFVDWFNRASLNLAETRIGSIRIWRGLQIASSPVMTIIEFGLPTLLCYLFVTRPLRFGLGVAAFFMAGLLYDAGHHGSEVLYQVRSFFGVMKVKYQVVKSDDDDDDLPQKTYPEYTLVHGTTLHGTQIRTKELEHEPISYYHWTGPVGQIFDSFEKTGARKNVAVIGLGSGTMSAWGEPGMRMTFYDIDPAVVKIAKNPEYFTYFTDSPADKHIILGDARLRIAEANDKEYDLIVVDAFSSDAIPIHLITREAIALYLQKLTDNGVLAVHISNRYLLLETVLGNIAQDLGVPGLFNYDSKDKGEVGKTASEWTVLAKNRQALGNLTEDGRWTPLKVNPAIGVWTDDFSNLLGVFEWKN
jgi:hypothetical protein